MLLFSRKTEFAANSPLLWAFLLLNIKNIHIFIKYRISPCGQRIQTVVRGLGGEAESPSLSTGGESESAEELSTWYMDGLQSNRAWENKYISNTKMILGLFN